MTYALTITMAKRSATIRVTGDLDYQTADNLVDVACSLLEQNALSDLHLDFGETAFLDSAALSGLLMLHRRATQSEVELHLDNRPPFLDRVLQVTGLFSHFVADDEMGAEDPNLVGQTGSGESSVR